MEEIIKGFVDETIRGLTAIITIYSGSLSELGKGDVEKVFFVMHSLTGSSAMFGFEQIATYSIHAERVFDQIRHDKQSVTPEIMENTVKISQVIRQIVNKENIDPSSIDVIEFFKNQLNK